VDSDLGHLAAASAVNAECAEDAVHGAAFAVFAVAEEPVGAVDGVDWFADAAAVPSVAVLGVVGEGEGVDGVDGADRADRVDRVERVYDPSNVQSVQNAKSAPNADSEGMTIEQIGPMALNVDVVATAVCAAAAEHDEWCPEGTVHEVSAASHSMDSSDDCPEATLYHSKCWPSPTTPTRWPRFAADSDGSNPKRDDVDGVSCDNDCTQTPRDTVSAPYKWGTFWCETLADDTKSRGNCARIHIARSADSHSSYP